MQKNTHLPFEMTKWVNIFKTVINLLIIVWQPQFVVLQHLDQLNRSFDDVLNNFQAVNSHKYLHQYLNDVVGMFLMVHLINNDLVVYILKRFFPTISCAVLNGIFLVTK